MNDLIALLQDTARPVTQTDRVRLIAEIERLQRAFKSFHRLLCERFDYCHDEQDWSRDQVSLIEWIATRTTPPPEPWWCATCKQPVDGIDVTFTRRHDARSGGCGQIVIALKGPPGDTSPLSHPALALLFDSHAVLEEVRKHPSGRQRTSPESVSDVLDAVVRLMRADAQTIAWAPPPWHGKRVYIIPVDLQNGSETATETVLRTNGITFWVDDPKPSTKAAEPPNASPVTREQALTLLHRYHIAAGDRECIGDEAQVDLDKARDACLEAMGVTYARSLGRGRPLHV